MGSTDITQAIAPSGQPTVLLVHEWAHLVTGEAHTPRWASLLRALHNLADGCVHTDEQLRSR